MPAIYTRIGQPVVGKQTDAYKFAVQRAEAIKQTLGLDQDVFLRVGGGVGQVISVSRHDTLADVVAAKEQVMRATIDGKLPTAPEGVFAEVNESLWMQP
ncbi:MAG: hypothetical protein ACK5LN_06125 [Propioniciclava sp.]